MEKEPKPESSRQTRAVTEIKLVECSLEWCIKNFSFSSSDTGEYIRSPSFSSEDNNQVCWYLQLYPKGKTREYKDYLSLSILLQCPEKMKVEAQYKLSFINDQNVEINTIKSQHTFTSNAGRVYKKAIKRDFIMDHKRRLLPNNTLTIFCSIKAGIECVTLNVQKQYDDSKWLEYRPRILDDFEQMLQNKTLSDTSLICRGKVFEVHKAILASRSPVFAAMYQNDMIERKNNQVIIDDMSHEELKELLRFIYSSKVDNLPKLSRGLLAAADKYNINDLKDMCEDFLCNDLTIENAAATLAIADLYRAYKLKDQASKFLISHRESIIDTPGFHVMKRTKPHLLVNVFECMVKNSKHMSSATERLKRKINFSDTSRHHCSKRFKT